MPVPSSYIIQSVVKQCSACDYVATVNRNLYCRFNEPSVTQLFMDKSNSGKLITDILKGTLVDQNGVCNEFQQMGD